MSAMEFAMGQTMEVFEISKRERLGANSNVTEI